MRGGARQGAARKKGALTKKTQEITAAALKDGVTPLEVMLGAMREAWEKDDKAGAANFAKDAAPYVHPRLAAVDAKVDVDATVAVSRIELVAPALSSSDDHTAH
jgi:hypothetical protein